ncbi:hypothetical protein DFH11DRAFT_1878713 [Phellopilus nigrolimitatus]|nr:hypothetical protein DFH11DRAFT_1878713 [Phellopilus nigrolimitatus]
MLSDVSSLTDISSDDDSFVPPNKAKKPAKKTGQWTLKSVLRAPRTAQYSVRTLYEEIVNGKVDLDPEYQREIVWGDAKQVGLIDSILRNFYIPPVIFAFSQSEDGEEKRTCIDGKQRLTSIQRFMDGQPGGTGKLLPQQYRSQFAHKQIVCMEYTDINSDAEREIFQRVQLGVALTPAGKLFLYAHLIYSSTAIVIQNVGERLDWSSSRGRDFQCVASAIYMMEKPNSTYPSAPVLDRWLQRVTPPTKTLKERVMDAFAVFRELVKNKRFTSAFLKPARISPIEFIMCVVLVDKYMNTHTLTQLASAIQKMRDDVRGKHADIRANSKVTKTMLTFVFQRFPANLKKADASEKTALIAVRSNIASVPREKGKRKRSGSSSSSGSGSGSEYSSEDERPLKAKAKKTAKTVASSSASTPKAVSSRDRNQSSSKANVGTSKDTNKYVKIVTKIEPAPASRPQPRTDRLAGLRAAKAKAALTAQGPTPPPTSVGSGNPGGIKHWSRRHGSRSNAGADARVDPTVLASILNNAKAPTLQQQQWPGSTMPGPGVTTATPQMMQMMLQQQVGMAPATPTMPYFSPSLPPAGSMLPPNGTGPGTRAATPTADPRFSAQRASTYPSVATPTGMGADPKSFSNPNANGGSGGGGGPAPIPQKPQFEQFDGQHRNQSQANAPQAAASRSLSGPTGTASGGGGSMSMPRESRFDRRQSYPASGAGASGSGSGSNYATPSPRQPPTEPRGLGASLTSPREANGSARPRYSHGGPPDRERFVLNGYGSINGRERERERDSGYSGGWSSRGGGANGVNGR